MPALLGLLVLLADARAEDVEITDAISREFSVFVDLSGSIEWVDATSREFSAFNDLAPPVELTDAVGREFSAFNDLTPAIELTDAVGREFTAFNDLTNPILPTDAISREFVVNNFYPVSIVTLNSSGTAAAAAVGGTSEEQLATLNAGPPSDFLLAVRRRNANIAPVPFVCSSVPDPLALPFVWATDYLSDADEVTYDNCNSAFYQWTFELPPRTAAGVIYGVANADDMGVAFLNGQPISAAMLASDAGIDRTDGQGRPVLTAPTPDTFTASDPTFVGPGLNDLVFGVAGDVSGYEPTGIEFRATVAYYYAPDFDRDGDVDLTDFNVFGACFNGPNRVPAESCAANADFDDDGDVDLEDFLVFQHCFNGPNNASPEMCAE